MKTLFIAFLVGSAVFWLLVIFGQVVIKSRPLVINLANEPVEPPEIEKDEKAVASKLDPAEVYKDLGVSYLELGKLDEAIVGFKKAIQIDPRFVEAYYLLADVYSLKGEGILSRKSLDQAMALEGSYIIDTVRPNGNTPEYSIIELPPPAVLQEFTNPIKPTNPPDFLQGPIKTGVPGK